MSALVLNLTMMCNARCAFCIVLDTLNDRDRCMSDDEIFASLDRARAEGAREVNYSGGEPTIHKRFVEIVRYARDIGFEYQSVNTNGIVLKNAEYCRAILDAGMSSIDFSIHGHTEELHDREVDRKGAFAAILRAAENLRALRSEFRFHMSATTVITRHNHGRLLEIVRLLDELGFDNKRLKYAYEGELTEEQVINEVAPYEEAVPSIQAALEYLASRDWGFHFTHVPICLMGDEGAFSHDFVRRPAVMAFRGEAYEGDAAHYFRQHADACASCVIANQCTRLDSGYRKFHGSPPLRAFTSHDEIEEMFAAATAKYPRAGGIIAGNRAMYLRHRDEAALQTRRRDALYGSADGGDLGSGGAAAESAQGRAAD